MNIGETTQLGAYIVRCTLRFDNPYFPKFLIFRRGKLLGVQFSMPCVSDCRWHETRKGQYALPDETKDNSSWQLNIQAACRRGRPTNAERARRALLQHAEELIAE